MASVVDVEQISSTQIKLTVSSLVNKAPYTLTVTNVADQEGTVITDSIAFVAKGGPRVVSAVSLNTTTIRVTFNETMGNTGLTTPGNYVFTGPALAPITAAVVTKVSNTSVDVTIPEEMQTGTDNYTVTVSNVINTDGYTITSEFDHAIFNGIGVAPQIVSATSTAIDTIRVVFNENMNDIGLTTDSNYTFTCPVGATITVGNVTKINATTVDITTVGEMLTGVDNYTVTVTNVIDVAGNVIDPTQDSDTFNGMGVAPRVFSATATSITIVRVVFNEAMRVGSGANALDLVTNYSFPICPLLGTITPFSVAIINDTTVDITVTGDMKYTVGADYNVEVINVMDVAGNVIDAAFDNADFIGKGKPRLVSATRSGLHDVVIVFDQPMSDTGLTDNSHYTFSNPGTAPIVTSGVVKDSTTQVTVTTTGEMKTGVNNYTATVIHVINPDNDVINATYDEDTFDGLGTDPQVSSASATSTVVEVVFNEAMGDGSGITEFIRSANYVFTTCPVGAAITVSSIHRESATKAHIVISGEMLTGVANYTLTVDNVIDVAGNTIDGAHKTATFNGVGVAPQVSSATSTATDKVRVVFNENMSDTGLTTNGNYSFTCPAGATITVGSVAKINATTVDITTSGEMLTGTNNYTVTVINVTDTVGNVIDPAHDDDTFNGIGVAPQLTNVTVLDHGHAPNWLKFRLFFDEELKDEGAITTVTNYEVTGPVRGYATYNPDTAAFGSDHTNIDILCNREVASNEPYTILAKNLHDVVGNDLDLDHDSYIRTTGIVSDKPQVDGGAYVSQYEVTLHFNEDMADNAAFYATASYTVQNTGTLVYYAISEATRNSSVEARLVLTDPLPAGSQFKITAVASNVCDLAGNYINAPTLNYTIINSP